QRMAPEASSVLVEAMSADQQADLIRELPAAQRERLLDALAEPTRRSLRELLQFPPESAGGIMTTEFVSMPSDWTVARALQYIADVGRAKETVYAVYVLDAEQRLMHVVSLRELMTASRDTLVSAVGDRRPPLSVPAATDREEVARLISKYNLLA